MIIDRHPPQKLSISHLIFAVSLSIAPALTQADTFISTKPEADTKTHNWYLPGYKHWSFKHMDKVFNTAVISKGKSQNPPMKKRHLSLDKLRIEQLDGTVLSYRDHLAANHTDGLLVIHDGDIVAEEYLGEMSAESYHNWFSMTKSFTGLTAAILAQEGKIDLQKPTIDYMPELIGSAWEGTTVQMVMDMTVGIQFNEDYSDSDSDLYQFGRAARFIEIEDLPSRFDSAMDYLKTVKKAGQHDQVFHYVSLNSEILGMIIKKVTDKQPAEIMSEKIWSKLAAEHDAYIVEDPTGLQLVSAAINTTLRDAGKFGQMVLQNGAYNGQQIIPADIIAKLRAGGNVDKFAPSKRGKQFPGFSYTDQWWHTNGNAFFAKGLFGQWMYIDPDSNAVIVKYSTSDVPSPDWTNDLRLMRAISHQLRTAR